MGQESAFDDSEGDVPFDDNMVAVHAKDDSLKESFRESKVNSNEREFLVHSGVNVKGETLQVSHAVASGEMYFFQNNGQWCFLITGLESVLDV